MSLVLRSIKEGDSAIISEDFLTACKSKDFNEFLELQKISWRAARPGFDGELFCTIMPNTA